MGSNSTHRMLWLAAAVLAGIAGPAHAQEGDDQQRGVARISLMNGEVSVRRGDAAEWVAGVVNAPLMTDDRISTAPNSRAEVQFDSANLIRLGGNAEVHVVMCLLSIDVASDVDRLIDQVTAFGLPDGLTNALDAKLRAAVAGWQRGNRAAVAGQLGAFIHLVSAQRRKALTDEQADSLIGTADAIVAAIKSGRAN